MIRQNRAVPILMVLTLAWVLYLAGCFGSEEPEISVEDVVPTTVIPTPTPEPVVTDNAAAALVTSQRQPYQQELDHGGRGVGRR